MTKIKLTWNTALTLKSTWSELYKYDIIGTDSSG